jgi:hypothetical protein
MADGRTELFTFMGAAFATLVGLFVLHGWYASYIDVRYQDSIASSGPAEGMVAAREADEKQLAAGKIPIAQAMQTLAQRGRTAFGSVSPNASEDLSAVAGWIHSPHFKPVVAHPIRTARAPVVAAPAAPAIAEPAPTATPAAPGPKVVAKPAPAPAPAHRAAAH